MSTRAGFLNVIERSAGRTIASVGLIFVALYLCAFTVTGSGRRPINGDAVQYYAYLRSIVFDRDLDFTNDYAALYGATETDGNIWQRERTVTGLPPNQMSVGPAILWAPAYLFVLLLLWIAGATSPSAPALLLVPGVAGICYATLGAYLCFRTAARRFDRHSALWGTLVAWLAGPAIYYSLVSPAYSHTTSMFVLALFVYVWMSDIGRVSVARFALLGAIGGLAAIVRWQDAIILVLPALDLLRALRREARIVTLATASAALLASAAVVAWPQLVAWKILYGSYLAMPQGSGFMRWTEPEILSVLLSRHHGLWLWTPAMLIATGGLAVAYRRDRYSTLALGGILAVTIYVNAAVSDWWAGEAFGARRFVGDTVIFGLGLTAVLDWLGLHRSRVWTRAVAIGLIVYNGLFLLQYVLFMLGYRDLAPYPATYTQILFDRLWIPYALVREWLGR